jgi:hypothetical protein
MRTIETAAKQIPCSSCTTTVDFQMLQQLVDGQAGSRIENSQITAKTLSGKQ